MSIAAAMPSASTPLYSHSLPEIESWLTDMDCQRDTDDISRWLVRREDWSAEIYLDVESIVVDYETGSGKKVQRSFKYSLSRGDLEEVIFSGP